MEEILIFLEENQSWIYGGLFLLGLVYLRTSVRWLGEYRAALFGLERERAMARLTRSGAMLVLVLSGIVMLFVLTTFVSPALPTSSRPTPVPTASLLTTPSEATPVGESTLATPMPLSEGGLDGCLNPLATLIEPADGDTLEGVVTVRGTANIESFAFYKFEYRDRSPDAPWRAVFADIEPKVDEELGTWDTTLVNPGEYDVRLVVTDTIGNAPQPCMISVRVLPAP